MTLPGITSKIVASLSAVARDERPVTPFLFSTLVLISDSWVLPSGMPPVVNTTIKLVVPTTREHGHRIPA